MPRFVIPLFLFLVAVGCRPENNGEPSPAISRQMREYKTEIIRSRILSDLPEPPSSSPVQHIPSSVISLLAQKKVEESLLSEGKNHISYPINENFTCPNETLCSRFEFELPSDDKKVTSMHVWIPEAPSPEQVTVSGCFSIDDGGCTFVKILPQPPTELGWAIFEFPQRAVLQRSNDEQYCSVEITGVPDKVLEEKKPFLVSNLQAESAARKRRNSNTRNCTCCLVDFYVNFKEIGLHWVVAPEGVSANMCYGRCSNHLNTHPSHYHSIMNALKKNKTITNEQKEDLWTPCCSPTKLSPLNMIYVAGNSTHPNTNSNSSSSFIYHKIPDMITESCGCR